MYQKNKVISIKNLIFIISIILLLLFLASCKEVEVTKPKDFKVEYLEADNGILSFDKTEYNLGEDVKITITPSEGYKLKSLFINDNNVIYGVNNNNYYIRNAKYNVSIRAEFVYSTTVLYEVSFYSNTFLIYSYFVEEGVKAVYNEDVPTKESSKTRNFVFDGWFCDNNKYVTELPAITKDSIFIAEFVPQVRYYNVLFISDDGVTLYEENVEFDGVPSFSLENPTKESDNYFNYSFFGWDKKISNTRQDTIYTAVFSKTTRYFNVSYLDLDNNIVCTEKVEYNNTPASSGILDNCYKESYFYLFKGLSKQKNGTITSDFTITSDTIFYAIYTSYLTKTNSISFFNETSTILLSVVTALTGESYVAPTPTKTPTQYIEYIFTGWADENNNIVTNMISLNDSILHADFTSIPRRFDITFLNYDDSVISVIKIGYGSTAYYEGEQPFREHLSELLTYEFIGWDKEFEIVNSDDTYKAQYQVVNREYSLKYIVDNNIYEYSVEYNHSALYNGDINISKNGFTYLFMGWKGNETYYPSDAVLPNVTYNVIYEAVYKVTSNDTGFITMNGFESGNGTISNPYIISTYYHYMYLVTESLHNSFEGIYIKINNDISLENIEVSTIGNALYPFKGILDGYLHTISGININNTSTYVSIFYSNYGTIKNIKYSGDIKAASFVSGLVLYNYGFIDNVTNDINIVAASFVSGLVLYNYGEIYLPSNTGAIYNTSTEQYITSLVGNTSNVNGCIIGINYNILTLVNNVLWDGSSYSAFSGLGSEISPYVIDTASKLYQLSRNVSSGTLYENKYFVLGASIDLNNYNFPSIGNSSREFKGNFDGCNFTIYNFVLSTSGSRQGLFGRKSGYTKNIILYGNVVSSYEYSSILIGISYGDVSNNTVFGNITNTNIRTGLIAGAQGGGNLISNKAVGSCLGIAELGGIVGYNWLSGTLANITYNKSYVIVRTTLLEGTSYAGGILGRSNGGGNSNVDYNTNYGNVYGVAGVGGIAGYNSQASSKIASFNGNINYGDVISLLEVNDKTNSFFFGGIIGMNGSLSTISNCNNYGKIQASGKVGGGVGGITGSNYNSIIDNCNNYGEIISNTCAGGITGINQSSGGIVRNSNNYGKLFGVNTLGGIVGYAYSGATNIENCTNTGNITGITNMIAGIVGRSNGGKNSYISNCINNGNVIGDYEIAGIVGYNSQSSDRTSYILGCVNNGNITSLYIGSDSKHGYFVGGIVGMNGSNGYITNCTNNGDIEASGGKNGGVGGIAGSNYNSILSYSNNYGKVSGYYRVGGIVGYQQNSLGEISNCSNYGNFESYAYQGTVSLGGIVGYNIGSISFCINYGSYDVIDGVIAYGYIIGRDEAAQDKVIENENNYD
jgi:hypothetical protein